MKIQDILKVMCERDASDVFIKAEAPPSVRVYGLVAPMAGFPVLSVSDIEKIISEITDETHKKILKSTLDTDFSVDIEGLDRFRASIFYQRGLPSIVLRRIKKVVPDFEALNLKGDVLKRLSLERRGLILMTGPAGNGKSTTIASMIEYMNYTNPRHVLTVEDPIEFTFADKKCIINQRELGIDVASYPVALRQLTLQSPDVIFIGTIRDVDTMKAALSAAEMGVLVLSTLHTVNAVQTIQRIINFFTPYEHAEIRMQLSFLLKGVISLRLVPRADGKGRVPATEIMTLTPTISHMIREGLITEIPRYLEEGGTFGMESFKQSLARLVKENKISAEEAFKFADSKEDLDLEIKGIKRLT